MIEEYMNGLRQHRFKTYRQGTKVAEQMIRFKWVAYQSGVTRVCGQRFSLGASGFLDSEDFEIVMSPESLANKHTLHKTIRQFFGKNLTPCRKSEFAYRVGVWADAF